MTNMNYLNGNDNKSIKSALNDKKRNGVKLTIERSIFWRDKLHLKNGTTNDKFRVNECKNDKKRKILLSFVIILCFLCGKNCGSSDKCVVFVPKRWTEMKIAKILSLPLVTPN